MLLAPPLSAVLAILLIIPVWSSSARAEPLTENRPYQGKVLLEVAALNLAFELPAGWTGVLPAGTRWFHVGKNNEEGRVFVYADRVGRAEMRALMSRPFPVADALLLTPRGTVSEEGATLSGEYDASDGGTRYLAHARVLTSKSGVSVALVAVAPPGKIDAFKQLARAIERSVQLDVAPAAATAETGSGRWAKALANKRVMQFHHGSGYSEKTAYLLCEDGRFFRSFGASSVSQNGSGVAQSKDAGRWSVSGDALTLVFGDGRSDVVRLEDRNGQLWIEGARWLREDASCS